nr:MAG TPA: hypothetical protein [Caudoviricetes sp.]
MVDTFFIVFSLITRGSSLIKFFKLFLIFL